MLRRLAPILAVLLLAAGGASAWAQADEAGEYRVKAAFVYNFLAYTEWPVDHGPVLTLCLAGPDPFAREIDALQGKAVGARSLAVQRRAAGDPLRGCQAVYFAPASLEQLPRLLEGLRGQGVLTLADSPGAARRGLALNMLVQQGRVTFEANLAAARGAGLGLSSKLLRLAVEVHQ